MRRLAPFALVLVGACSLRPVEPVYRYYVLTPELARGLPADDGNGHDGNGNGHDGNGNGHDANGHSSDVAVAEAPSLVIGRITVPDYLGRESFATRIEDQRLEYSKEDRWAEPLEEGIVYDHTG